MKRLHNVSSLSFIRQHPPGELLVSKSQAVILHHAQGRKKGPRARERLTMPLLNTKTLLPLAQHPVMTRQRRLRPKVTKPKRQVRISPRSSLPRPPEKPGQRTQIPAGRDVGHSVPSHSPIPPLRSPTAAHVVLQRPSGLQQISPTNIVPS